MPTLPSTALLRSLLASTARAWRGTQVLRRAAAPKQLLILFDRENDPNCRLLRELLTELQLDALIQPCPIGGQRFARKLAGNPTLPVLVDRDHGMRAVGVEDSVRHLLQQYAQIPDVAGLLSGWPMRWSSRLASALRGDAGLQARPSRSPRQALELYSFESSPYSRLVRERLCELELPWILRSFGKEQLADWGPPQRRFTLRRWTPKAGGRRERMLADTGKAQVPYLIDPNTHEELFESTRILEHLERHYAR